VFERSADAELNYSGFEQNRNSCALLCFADELAEARIDISRLGEWGWGKQHSTNRDIVYTKVTKYLWSQHKVELILLHLNTPDSVEHGYGPNTPGRGRKRSASG
jgi:hypothetical protein